MKRSSRGGDLPASRRVHVAGVALLVGAMALPLGACSFTNPKTTAVTYAASDGVNGEITDDATGTSIQLRNMLLVATEAQQPGLLIGAVNNEGATAVDVTFTVLDGTGNSVGGGTVRASAQGLTELDGVDTAVRVASVPTAPGAVLQLQVDTPSGGQRLSLPVLAAEGPYASLTPQPEVASATPSVTPSPSAS